MYAAAEAERREGMRECSTETAERSEAGSGSGGGEEEVGVTGWGGWSVSAESELKCRPADRERDGGRERKRANERGLRFKSSTESTRGEDQAS